MSSRDLLSRIRRFGPTSGPRGRHVASAGVAALVALGPLAVAPGSAPLSAAAGPARPAVDVAPPSPWQVLERTGSLPVAVPWMQAMSQGVVLPSALQPTSAGGGIPPAVKAAYVNAADSVAATSPTCHLPWWLLAGIGHVESGHAAGGSVDAQGRTVGNIFGPRLDGSTPQTATVADTDAGSIDGDATYDRAVGPMQFLPSTWRSFASDGNGDGQADPQNISDAALSAARYLCSGGDDLANPASMRTAVLRYNPSEQYVTNVIAAGEAYRDGRPVPETWRPPMTPDAAIVPPASVGGVPVGVRRAVITTAPQPVASAATPAPSTPSARSGGRSQGAPTDPAGASTGRSTAKSTRTAAPSTPRDTSNDTRTGGSTGPSATASPSTPPSPSTSTTTPPVTPYTPLPVCPSPSPTGPTSPTGTASTSSTPSPTSPPTVTPTPSTSTDADGNPCLVPAPPAAAPPSTTSAAVPSPSSTAGSAQADLPGAGSSSSTATATATATTPASR